MSKSVFNKPGSVSDARLLMDLTSDFLDALNVVLDFVTV